MISRLSLAAALAVAVQAAGAQEDDFAEQAQILTDALVTLGANLEEIELSYTFVETDVPDGATFSMVGEGDAVVVGAKTSVGAAHAAATLLRTAQIEDGRVTWPRLELVDGPDMPYRAFMVDMGRNPHGPETLRRIADMLWYYRVNVLHLHLTDDQMVSWPSKAFPKIHSERSGWTWDDFVELEAYCVARGIEIVPEIDVPGHSTILRREYPEVFGESPTDLATKPEAQKGVETLIDEMLSVFTSATYFHVGGDEAYGVPEDVQRDFINRLDAHVNSRGLRTVVWEGPSLGEGDNKIDTDVLHVNWRTIDFPAQQMLDAGYEVVNAAWDPMYVVDHYPRTMFTAVETRRCFEWDPRRFAHINHGMPTFAKPHTTTSDEGIVGFCMPWWEGRQENVFALCLPRLAAVATAAWDLERPGGFEAFQADYELNLPRLLAVSGIELPALPIAPADTQEGNLAFGRVVTPSSGATQPHFGPQRLTNGVTDRFDHFLGFPTKPEPLEITVDLGAAQDVARVVVHEDVAGNSFEQYRVLVSPDGEAWETVGESAEGKRGEATSVEHVFDARPVRYVRLETDGCQNLTFPSFSRLTEIQVYGPR